MQWKALTISIATVGSFFIFWDELFSQAKYWSFNEKFIIGIRIMDLPLEEILFFITVPYACLFTYESILFYMKERELPVNRLSPIISGVIMIVIGLFFFEQHYTLVVMIITGSLLIFLGVARIDLVRSRRFWMYILITTGLFFIFNIILTSIPIVTYQSSAIWGGEENWDGRFFSIPIEDLFYNFSMLTMFLIVYIRFRKEYPQVEDD